MNKTESRRVVLGDTCEICGEKCDGDGVYYVNRCHCCVNCWPELTSSALEACTSEESGNGIGSLFVAGLVCYCVLATIAAFLVWWL